jgi:sodium-dependent dicarboxylate transporter 2/3/5
MNLKKVGLFLGPISFLFILLFIELDAKNPHLTSMLAIACLVAIWWITDAIPLAATALLPLILIPLLGIMSVKKIAPSYMPSILFLFVGGFMIALAMDKWNLHKRIALNIISLFNGSPNYIILGFMVATSFLSMWISNTATTVMMVPIGLAIIYRLETTFGKDKAKNFTVALMLSIAYSASIGGISTPVGTPPNLTFIRIFEMSFPNSELMSFGTWMTLGVPIKLSMLVFAWLVITKLVFRFDKSLEIDRSVIIKEKNSLKSISYEEKAVLVIFVLTALLWILRKDLNLGFTILPGWSSLLENPKLIDDSVVAIFMALILFIIPSRTKNKAILNTSVFTEIPWHIIVLFGGGFALAKGMKDSGLSEFIGQQFVGLEHSDPLLIVSSISFGITFLTELTSNMSTTEMILPILASISESTGLHPYLLLLPATKSASCAFMLPAATAPNAIVFGSNRLKILDMVKTGFVLNLIGIVIISLWIYFLTSVGYL